MEVLERGGSAVDAAIAVQAMLSLVEPQSSGLGGGAFINYYDAATRKLTIYDGRETAPAQATPGMFLDSAGKPLPFDQAVLSGRATGVPGAVQMLALAHREHGKLAWRSLFGSAERTADEGFIVSPRLGRLLAGDYAENSAPDVVAYFRQADGSRMVAGDRLRNPAYAAFLRRLADAGPGGDVRRRDRRADRRAHPRGAARRVDDHGRPRQLSAGQARGAVPPLAHLRRLRPAAAVERGRAAPAAGDARAEPTSPQRGPADPQAWFLFAEASRIMYADRDRYVGDPAFVTVPVEGLLDPAYLGRARDG